MNKIADEYIYMLFQYINIYFESIGRLFRIYKWQFRIAICAEKKT